MSQRWFALPFVCAALAAQAAPSVPVIPDQAQPLPLSAVRLTGGPLKRAQDLNRDYLLKLEPDRMLYFLRERAGLKPKAAQPYGGWDGPGRQLTGHICGHYLSAVSLMYAATGEPEFKKRADYIVAELKNIQDRHGDGYIGALLGNAPGGRRDREGGTNELVDGKALFQQLASGTIASGGFDLNGMWSPWYVQHKLYAGLRDAYRYAHNHAALEVEIRFAAWAEQLLSGLSPAAIQRMLATEFGAMNEIMIDLYADTGDRRWLRAADLFQHDAIVNPLARHEDILQGKHGNTQVPKLMGSLKRFIHAGDSRDGYAAAFFWDRVVQHHSFVTGGHGRNEYFGQPGKLEDMIDGRTAETCNVYNMLRMTRRLFSLWPDAHYADFQERALFNHILGSIHPESGSTCYMVCVGDHPRQREYADMFGSFTCCVGSGMESHALHGDGLFYASDDKLWVNIYTPATAEWVSAALKLELQSGGLEEEAATLNLRLARPREFTLMLRRPFWTTSEFSVQVNGAPVAVAVPEPLRSTAGLHSGSTYLELKREWKDGDTIQLRIPKALRLEHLPDNPARAAILWGPLVLSGDLGPETRPREGARTTAAPALITANRPLQEWIKPLADKPGCFHTEGVGRDRDVELVPFYRLHNRSYAVYWNIFTPEEWNRKSAELAAARERAQKLEAATVAYAQPGEMQPERDFNFQGEDSSPVRRMDRPGRRGARWFSFDLPVDPSAPMVLIVTYLNDEPARRSFEILADGQRLGSERFERRSPEQVARFFDVEYPLPASLVKDRQKITVRFQATEGNEIATVYGLRMLRADAAR